MLSAEYSSGKKIRYSLPEDGYGFSEDFFRQIHPLLYKELNKHSHSFVPLLNVFPGISPDPKWIQAFSFYRHSDKLEDNSHFSFTRVSGEPVFSGRYYSADTQKLIFCDHVVLTPKEEQTLLTLFVQSKLFFLSEEIAKTLDLQISEGIEEIHLISLSTEKKHDQVENYRIVSSPCTDPDCQSSFFLLLRDLTEKYAEIQ